MEKEFKNKVWDMIDEIEEARKFHGFTWNETCEKLGITRQTYSNWLNRNTFPDWGYIDNIKSFLEQYGRSK